MIRSPVREVIRRQAVIRRGRGIWFFCCDRCAFRRVWATEQGAVNGVAAHLQQAHGARLTLERAS